MADLTPANENPWYVLMTLYGEQEGIRTDLILAEKNRFAWNIWAIHKIELAEKNKLQEAIGWKNVNAQKMPSTRLEALKKTFTCEMSDRNGPDFEISEFPLVEDDIDLTGLDFPNRLDISKFIFTQGVDFYKSNFQKRCHAPQSYFWETVKFQRCDFRDIADFSKVTFGRSAGLFQSNFHKGYYGRSAKYYEFANFAEAVFHDVVEMSDVVFSGASHFVETVFRGGQGKRNTQFSLNDTIFEKPANFGKANFEFQYPTSSGSVFHADSSFSSQERFWPTPLTISPIVAKEFCVKVRVILSKQGFADEEHTFFRREMGFSGQIGKWWERLPFRAFGWVSDYGHSIWRPVIALVALWTLGMLIYLIAFAARDIEAGLLRVDLNAAALSFANMFKFLGFQRTYFDVEELRGLSAGLQVWGGLQTILGFVLLFFLGLGLRTRFRLR